MSEFKTVGVLEDRIILYKNQKLFVVWKDLFFQAIKFTNTPRAIGWYSFILNHGMDEKNELRIDDDWGNQILMFILENGMKEATKS